MNAMSRFFVASAVVLGLSFPSLAAVINVDFGQDIGGGSHSPEYVGTAAAPDAGTAWNGRYLPLSSNTPSLPSGALVDSFGGASSVTFLATQLDTPASDTGLAGANLPSLGIPDDYSQTLKPALVQDQLYVWNNRVGTMVFSGLTAPQYMLYVYSVRGGNFGADNQPGGVGANADTPAGNRTSFTIGATTLVTDVNDSATTGLTLNEDYVVFMNLTPVAGQITMTWTSFADGYGAISAMQLVSVPEPSSFLLAITGMCVLWRVRRK